MIVRLSNKHLTKLFSNTTHNGFMLFCNKKPKGFQKFGRKITPKTDQKIDNNDSNKQSDSQKNTYQYNTEQRQAPKGFGKFNRKSYPHQKHIHSNKQKQIHKQKQQHVFQSKDSNNANFTNKNQPKGFNKFNRPIDNKQKPENQTQSQNIKQSQNIQAKQKSQNTQAKQNQYQVQQEAHQNKQSMKQNNESQTQSNIQNQKQHLKNSGFGNFIRPIKKNVSNGASKKQQNILHKKDKPIQQQKPQKYTVQHQKQPYIKQQANNIHKKQQETSTKSSIQKQKLISKGFKNFMPKNQPNNKQHKQQQAQKQQQKPQKTAQQKQKQQMDKKQEFFMHKINQFKRLKRLRQQQQNSPYSILKKQKQKLINQLQKKTGYRFEKKTMEPPQFIKKNPVLLSFYLILQKLKVFIIMGIIFYLYGSIDFHTAQIESDEVYQLIDSGQVLSITFLSHLQQRDGEFGKKQTKYGIIMMKNGDKKQFVNNTQFQKSINQKLTSIKLVGGEAPAVFYDKNVQSNYGETFRSLLTIYLLYIMFTSISLKKGGPKGGGRQDGGGMANIFGETKSRRFQQPVNVRFQHVVGMQKSKDQIVQFIDFLRHPQKYQRLGAKIPKGALLTGPPGTGKTMIAKACAGESQVPFFTISGSQFMQMYVGVGAQRVRELFKQAKQNSPSIIFIDQIDAVGKKRASGVGGGNDERDNTLNQLLVEMDGFNTGTNVIVFAATNQKDVLDPALTRPGRFDRLIEVDLPDIQGRKQIFKIHLKPIVIDSQSSIDQYARRMATLTPGFSGADIRNLCNEAAIIAARQDHKHVTLHDFQMATQRVIGGVEKKSSLITPQTKKVVAYHECGHGVCSWFLEGANPLLKLTIIPRSKGALGFAQYLPYESQISTRKQLEDQICVILGGRISQQVFFNKVSTGAYDDLQKAYQVAKQIVSIHGMSDKLGWLRYEQTEYTKLYSKKTEQRIDKQMLQIIQRCTQRTRQIITQKRDLIEKLAQKLLEKETIDQTIISETLGQRPFKANKQYEEYLKEKKKMSEQLLQITKTRPSDNVL